MYSQIIEAKTRKIELLFIFNFLFMVLAYFIPTKEKKVSKFSIIILIILNFENFSILFIFIIFVWVEPCDGIFISIFPKRQ